MHFIVVKDYRKGMCEHTRIWISPRKNFVHGMSFFHITDLIRETLPRDAASTTSRFVSEMCNHVKTGNEWECRLSFILDIAKAQLFCKSNTYL